MGKTGHVFRQIFRRICQDGGAGRDNLAGRIGKSGTPGGGLGFFAISEWTGSDFGFAITMGLLVTIYLTLRRIER